MKFSSLNSLIHHAGSTFYRFPFVLLSAFLGTISVIYLDLNNFDSNANNFTIVIKFLFVCTLALTLFFSLNLIGERKIIPVRKNFFLELAGLVILAIYYFFLPEKSTYVTITRYVLFNISLHLLCAFAPFIGKKEPIGFWQFNKGLFLSILTSLLYSFVLFTGLSIALLAVDNLFDILIPGEVYRFMYYIILGIFNTWFFLSRVPSDFSALNDTNDYPKGLKIFTQFILLPLVTLYLTILYGYELKILLPWELPKGYISYLVLAFSILGILSLLLIYPIRNNKENKWILTFSRCFYFALFPLIVLLFIAIFVRLNEYGITENRYFIFVIALWLASIATYFLVKKEASIKVIPVSLCLIIFLSSFGPWGAFYVAKKSQVYRFESILNKNSLLNKNNIIEGSQKISDQDISILSSSLQFLDERRELKEVSSYFGPKSDSVINDPYITYKAYPLMDLVDIEYDRRDFSSTYFNFYLKDKNPIVVKGFDYDIKYIFNNYNANDEPFVAEGKDFDIHFDKKSGDLSIKESEMDFIKINVKEILKDSLNSRGGQTTFTLPVEKMSVIKENKFYTVKVILNSITMVKSEYEDEITNMETDILLKQK